MVWDLLVFSTFFRFCISFNISDLTSSHEKITRLLTEDAAVDKGKGSGYNVAKVKLANEVILQLMGKGSKKEHGDEILRLVNEYTVGMNENTLDLVTLNDIKNMFRTYDDIFAFGKPAFIDHECDLPGMRARLKWDEGLVNYFKYIREDASKAWNYFADQFSVLKNTLKLRL